MKLFHRNIYAYLFVFLLYIFSVTNGIVSRDFGAHWDEGIITSAVSRSYKSGLFVQDIGNYPSALYYQTLIVSLPHLMGEFAKEDQLISTDLKNINGFAITQPSLREAMKRTGEYVLSKEFLLLARTVACAVAFLSIFWLFLIAKELFDSKLAGLLAATILFGSWEFFYHARFLATDLVMVQWGLVSVLMLIRFLKHERAHDLVLCGFFAGIATASKYQGGLYWILSLCALTAFCRKSEFGLFRLLLLSGASYITGFLLLNPTIILNPLAFIEGFLFVSAHYAGNIESYTVPWRIEPGLTHGWLLFNYVTTQLSSKFIIISILTSLLSAFGLYCCVRDRRWHALILFIFPLFYIIYFAGQSVMIVRNYLCLLPFIAIFAAYGGLNIWNSRDQWFRGTFLGFIAVAAVFNSAWMVYSSRSITHYDFLANNAALVEFLEQEKGKILVSNEIWALISEDQRKRRIALNTESNNDPRYLAIGYEIESWKLPANRRKHFDVLFGGPYEINFAYYPSFSRKREKKWRFVEVSNELVSKENVHWRFRGWPEDSDPISVAIQEKTPESIDTAIEFTIALLEVETKVVIAEKTQRLLDFVSSVESLNKHNIQLNKLGINLEKTGAHEVAARAFGLAAKFDSPIQGNAKFSQAKNLNLAQRYSEALPIWLDLGRKYPGLIDIKIGETSALIGSGQTTKSLTAANQLLKMLSSVADKTLTPQQCINLNAIAVNITNRGFNPLAAALFGKAASADSPIRGKAAFSQANCLNLAQLYEQALPLWIKLEQEFPTVDAVQKGKASALDGLSKAK